VRESACQFGPHRQLAGILTEPGGAMRRATVVLVSAGVTPKFGPFRLYAQLARRLAQDGFRTLRFDLGGIGDSGHEYEGVALEQRTKLQIGAALDHLSQRFELDGVVLGGLCSGAEDSFRHAEHDVRVTGVIMIDPFAYKTPGFSWRHFRQRAARGLLRAAGLYRPTVRRGGRALVEYQRMELAESSRIMQVLLERKVRLHFIYTAGMAKAFNHEAQLPAMFPGIDFADRVSLDHFPELDHTQPLEADRRLLIDAIARRLGDGSAS
jgi:pimeloyl-ACP methyl ester carboxylesterase